MWPDFGYDDDIQEDKCDLNSFDPVLRREGCRKNLKLYYRHTQRIKWYTSGFL